MVAENANKYIDKKNKFIYTEILKLTLITSSHLKRNLSTDKSLVLYNLLSNALLYIHYLRRYFVFSNPYVLTLLFQPYKE